MTLNDEKLYEYLLAVRDFLLYLNDKANKHEKVFGSILNAIKDQVAINTITANRFDDIEKRRQGDDIR